MEIIKLDSEAIIAPEIADEESIQANIISILEENENARRLVAESKLRIVELQQSIRRNNRLLTALRAKQSKELTPKASDSGKLKDSNIPRVKMEQNTKNKVCSKCNKGIAHTSYNRHFRDCGTKFICIFPGCHKVYSWAQDLRQHRRIHTDEALICICGRKYTRSYSLKQHQRHCLEEEAKAFQVVDEGADERSIPNDFLEICEEKPSIIEFEEPTILEFNTKPSIEELTEVEIKQEIE